MFAVQVQATGTQGDYTYLNSQLDYRDQRNLTIAITPAAARRLEAELGSHPLVALRGKRILVDGVAERTGIRFFAAGRPGIAQLKRTILQYCGIGRVKMTRIGRVKDTPAAWKQAWLSRARDFGRIA